MVRITSHVLDLGLGRPASGVPVRLERKAGNGWEPVGGGDAVGAFRLTFATGGYLAEQHHQTEPFYPEVVITFSVGRQQADQHFHIPLLLSPYGYSSYRGS
ncbi:hypothetical protein PBRA_006596 [Plasmodiophora brassicae]|uniref:Transthyretin/hydroxyisourate hydrolase domain-containing protein n=1 Tax=Plasmodiophora brassicae TaxID=37360 RepID=A0A0G4ITC5_PLABS|nr:hypothetical protein PBRA_006596 [Plasmodiophora brassicae]